MMRDPLPVDGYVLAGGKSSRMGTDKALVRLEGRPLIEHAMGKINDICADAYILAASPTLAPYGQLVPDLRSGCGPLGGIETALQHSSRDWVLVMPVDLPFVPTAFLRQWVERVVEHPGALIAYFEVAGKPQPTLLLIRRETRSIIASALERREYKLISVLETVGPAKRRVIESLEGDEAENWFLNLNSPEDLEIAACRTKNKVTGKVMHHKIEP